jgi:protein TonB
MYEHSLLATQRRSKARVLFVSVAIAVHAVILGGVAVGQYWAIDPVAEPPMVVSYVTDFLEPPPPPSGPPPPPKSRAAQPPSSVEIATAPVQPIAIPDVIPPAPDAPEIATVPGGVPDGVPNGVPHGVHDGVPGGDRFGVPGGFDGEGAPDGRGIRQVKGDVVKPEALARVDPVYTESARRARIQGVVIVETIIDTHGRVTDVRVLKSLPMGLSESAVDAVRQWRFKPATLDGRAVSVYFTLTVRFELQ